MKRLLLHLGLPKTATTSLQHNVLRKLHESREINFLGKDLSYEYETGRVTIHNYAGDFIRKVADGRMSVSEGRELLHERLKSNILNVFSDEGIMVSYPGRDNIPLEVRFTNLKELLFDVEVSVVITLRNPVDYFYSLYVELYPDYFSQIKSLNSFDKCVDHLLANTDDLIFESFFYENYLWKLEDVGCVTKLNFCDLTGDKDKFYRSWSELLCVEHARFKDLFEAEHVNEKSTATKGVKKIVSLKFISNGARTLLERNDILHAATKRLYDVLGLSKIFNARITFGSEHEKPTGDYRKKIESILKQ